MKLFDEETMSPKWYVVVGAAVLSILFILAFVFGIAWIIKWVFF